MSLTRKQFLGTLGKAAVGAAGVAVIAACGGGDDDDTGDDMGMADAPPGTPDAPVGTPDATPGPDAPPPSCVMNGTNVVISNPHQHAMVVTKEEVIAAAEKTYQIQGANPNHGHQVTLTAAHFQMLQNNMSVTVISTAGSGHTHSVTVSCA